MTNLEKRCESLEKLNESLQLENQKLNNQLLTALSAKSEDKPSETLIEEPIKEGTQSPTIKSKERQFSLTVQTNKTSKIVSGFQQMNISNTQIKKKFENKPKQPRVVTVADKKATKINKLKEWYSFDKTKIEEHQQEVLKSVRTDKTFANIIRDNGLPDQIIKYNLKPTLKEKKELEHPKPSGVPFKKWIFWLTIKTPEEAYKQADKFLYNMYKKEMYIYRQKWIKYSKEFNPYLCEPKAVWDIQVDIKDINQPFEFIQKWRNLVQTYKPSKPIASNWYINTTNNV